MIVSIVRLDPLKGLCIPKGSKRSSSGCGNCADESCSWYILFQCGKGTSGKDKRKTFWKPVRGKSARTKCKK